MRAWRATMQASFFLSFLTALSTTIEQNTDCDIKIERNPIGIGKLQQGKGGHAHPRRPGRPHRKESHLELTGVEALGEGGGVVEESAADPAADARRDDRAAHKRLRTRVAAAPLPRGGVARWLVRVQDGSAVGGVGARACGRRHRGLPSSL